MTSKSAVKSRYRNSLSPELTWTLYAGIIVQLVEERDAEAGWDVQVAGRAIFYVLMIF